MNECEKVNQNKKQEARSNKNQRIQINIIKSHNDEKHIRTHTHTNISDKHNRIEME